MGRTRDSGEADVGTGSIANCTASARADGIGISLGKEQNCRNSFYRNGVVATWQIQYESRRCSRHLKSRKKKRSSILSNTRQARRKPKKTRWSKSSVWTDPKNNLTAERYFTEVNQAIFPCVSKAT